MRSERGRAIRPARLLAIGVLLLGLPAGAPGSPVFDAGPSGYLAVTVLASRNSFGLDYSQLQNGVVTSRLQNGFGLSGTTAVPWYAGGLRLTPRVEVGAEYLSYASDRSGAAETKVQIGPLRFFVGDPANFAYLAEVARVWVSYDVLAAGAVDCAVFGGVTAAHLSLSANANGLGGQSESGTLGMPLVGARVQYGDPRSLRLAASTDYAYSNFGKAQGRAVDVSLLAERVVSHRIALGAGYRYYELRLDSIQPQYEAHFTSGFRGPFVSARWQF